MTDRGPELRGRAAELYRQHEGSILVTTDRLFARLLLFEWLAGILIAVTISPRTWAGLEESVHLHVWAAAVVGGAIAVFPVAMVRRYPGTVISRHSVAIGQMLLSALLIHLTGGRIETHFHIFGSLAFLSFYRDWRVLVTATGVVAVDHAVRGALWPQSVFGVLTSSSWRWLEHAGWVAFEVLFLIPACLRGRAEMREIASRRAHLEEAMSSVEGEVQARTAEVRRTIEELRRSEDDRSRLNAELVQAQRLEAVGQLAAGIAHEINTPTQFVGDNTRFLDESFGDLCAALGLARRLADASDGDAAELGPLAVELRAALEEADVEYLSREIPRAIEQSLEGIARVSKIVRAMKEFSHPGLEGMTDVDLNRTVESTITVATNEWKYVAEVVTDLAADLPPVRCIPGEISQVVLNLVVNAAHAIGDAVADGEKGRITVTTARVDACAEIRVADTGTGIPEPVRPRIFDPFFTTKEVGRGTGQGLVIARNTVVKKHGGSITFETETGRGTTFVVRLPFAQAAQGEDAAGAAREEAVA